MMLTKQSINALNAASSSIDNLEIVKAIRLCFIPSTNKNY